MLFLMVLLDVFGVVLCVCCVCVGVDGGVVGGGGVVVGGGGGGGGGGVHPFA